MLATYGDFVFEFNRWLTSGMKENEGESLPLPTRRTPESTAQAAAKSAWLESVDGLLRSVPFSNRIKKRS
jgi:hypothetical protein